MQAEVYKIEKFSIIFLLLLFNTFSVDIIPNHKRYLDVIR